ncbi:MAG TPA: RNA-binding transcriptional accessory protein, partial [Bacteroidales bacterium]|nr:RNA-binding transcriptional accessory protein [Bacteroidales bacterium]
KMAKKLGVDVHTLIKEPDLQKKIDPKEFVTDKTGLPTLLDIMQELAKPGRDPREQLEFFAFHSNVNNINDLREGMVLPGIVTNITAFGAFVDIGVHQDGLVHISQITNAFVSNPADVLKINQKVKVKVVQVDAPRKRISLSMKDV